MKFYEDENIELRDQVRNQKYKLIEAEIASEMSKIHNDHH